MNERSLEIQRVEFKQKRFLAMPIAGLLIWTIIGISGLLFFPIYSSLDHIHWYGKYCLHRYAHF